MKLPRQYVRRSYSVQAIQVSYENIYEIAAWCGGVVTNDRKPRIDMRGCVPRPPRMFANVGDWVLRSEKGHYKAYRDESFLISFELA